MSRIRDEYMRAGKPRPTATHRAPLIAAVILLAAVIVFLIARAAAAVPVVEPAGCRQVNYPDVCAASYAKCDNIGLNEACLAVAQLDGQLGYDAANGRKIPTSQNK